MKYHKINCLDKSVSRLIQGTVYFTEANKDEAFVRQAAENWTAGIKNLDLDYALGEDGKTMINTSRTKNRQIFLFIDGISNFNICKIP